jgi:parvulin-like peptidyl-prolyl isomerase
MRSELETAVEERELEAAEEPRDRTKILWVLVVAVFAVMIGFLWMTQQPDATVSKVRAKHILIGANMGDPADRQRALGRAKELRQRLLQGADFERMAKEYSNDVYSSRRGGDLGWAIKGTYDPNFEEYVWQAPVGEISDIIRTSSGYHIVVVVDRILSPADKHEQELRSKMDAAQKQKPAQP